MCRVYRDPSAISVEIDAFPSVAGNRRVVTIGSLFSPLAMGLLTNDS